VTSTIRFIVATLLFALGTWLLGWWTVPVVAVLFGIQRTRPALVGLAATVAWLVLLVVDASGGSITRLAGVLSGVMGLPAPVLYLATLLFPLLVAWSAASLGDAARAVLATSRQPS
jgi:hypothetical protein